MSDHKDINTELSNFSNKLGAIHPPDDESAIPAPDNDDEELQVLMWFMQIPPDNQEMLLVEFAESIMSSAADQKEEKTDEEDGSSNIGRFRKIYKSLPPIHQKNFRSKIKREYLACDSSGTGWIESEDVEPTVRRWGSCVRSRRAITKSGRSDTESDRLERFKVKTLDIRGVSGSEEGTSGGGGGNADGTGGSV